MIKTLLVLNSGSSSLKFQVFRLSDLDKLCGGQVSRIGGAAHFQATLDGGARESFDIAHGANHEQALAAVLDYVDRHDDDWSIAGVAHRIVHGGTRYVEPVIATPEIIADLRTLIPLAPLHQPHNLSAIEASERLVGHVPDIACFDTAFHAGQPDLFKTFAISREIREQGVRRYGFHGISYQWIARVLAEQHPELAVGRVVAAHLGNGASLCAMQAGRSVDTTMGMTALDGLPMGTRCGAIDAGAVLYMQQTLGMTADAVSTELYERSGLLGLSGMTNDVKALLESGSTDARMALDYQALKIAQYAAMMAVSMGGIDALVFTGGIGEHAAPVREAVLARLGALGPFQTLIIPANEERMMAIEAKALIERAL